MRCEEWYRRLPKQDKLLETKEAVCLKEKYGYGAVREAARDAVEEMRIKIREGRLQENMEEILVKYKKDCPQKNKEEMGVRIRECGFQESEVCRQVVSRMEQLLYEEERKGMQPVINATGVVLHTNLGRAPLGREITQRICQKTAGYSNLEYQLSTGKRGVRYEHFSKKLCRLTGAEDCIAVNNNAAAVLLMLSALTSGRETIVSRGELIEIGGKFRIPDVMELSGTKLVEVGTTNRTYVQDYANAVTSETAAFLKVHTSNYKICGFTHEAALEELVREAKTRGVPVLVDLGSGSLINADRGGVVQEETVKEILKRGADLVCFSADKLLGGPQAGIIAGKKELIDKISRHPLTRAVRIDKFTAAALEEVLSVYEKEDYINQIPVLSMLNRSFEKMQEMAEYIKKELENRQTSLVMEIRETASVSGGGSMPRESLTSVGIFVRHPLYSAEKLSSLFRNLKVPVIARIEDEWVVLDMRTLIDDSETELLLDELSELSQKLRINAAYCEPIRKETTNEKSNDNTLLSGKR